MTAREIFEELLRKRGIKDVDAFANPRYEDLADPFLMPDMRKAVDRICTAIRAGEKIAIYGDYDIDGMTATTILVEALTAFGGDVSNFIPSRFIDGYGMGKRGVDEVKDRGVGLIITVDTGSLSHEHIDYAQSLGVDVIVTDHHTVGDTLPSAVAVINPKRPDSKYPYKDNAGVGVAFTLIRALQTELEGLESGQEKWFLDLVAMGTVCDVVPLTGENRILVYWGIKVAMKTKRHGLRALAQVSDTELDSITPETFGFRFGPRLNASGRLDTAKLSMDLLSAGSIETAMKLALELDEQNVERRRLQKEILVSAMEQARGDDSKVLVVAGEGWSHGVVGIVASRLVEEFQRPAFVLGINDGIATGSARAYGDYHLAKAIMDSKDTIQKGGGHAVAAGVTLDAGRVDEFRKKINDYFADIDVEEQLKHLGAKADMHLNKFEGLDDELIDLVESMQPFGNSNLQPVFSAPVVIKEWRPVGADQTHAKAIMVDSNGIERDSIGFGIAKSMPSPGSKAVAKFHLEHNEWNGRKTIQHRLLEVKE